MFMLERNPLVTRLQNLLEQTGYKKSLNKVTQPNRFSNQMNHANITIEEYDTLAFFAQQEDSECLELLLVYSTRLINKQVSKFSIKFKHNNANEDLIQAGYLGLLNAIAKWDPEKGSFRTYSYYYIRMAIIEEVRRIDNIITIHHEDKATLIRKLPIYWVQYQQQNNNPTKKDFVEWLHNNNYINSNIGKFTVRDLEVLEQLSNIGSLDYEINDNDDTNNILLIDTIEDDIENNPENIALENERENLMVDLLEEILEILTDKQRIVFCLYNGLDKLSDIEQEIVGDRKITFKVITEVLRHRYPEDTWGEVSCNELNSRAMKRIKKYVAETDLPIDILR